MCTSNFIVPSRLNMIIDGQFGSTGKGLIAARIAQDNHIDVACARLSPNAGHTFYHRGHKCVTKQLPVAGIVQDRSTIFIGYGSVIDPKILFQEIEEFDLDPNRIVIHPKTAVITDNLRNAEKTSGIVAIASTQSGTGEARSSKILRTNPLAQNTPELQQFLHPYFDLEQLLHDGCHVLAETGQGFDLSLNVGYSYPYCTSNDIIPSSVLADFGLHPMYMGNCMMTIRTFPIRVGNPKDKDGNCLGWSGPVYEDSEELSWEQLGVESELTTVTKRVRRVFTFSLTQYVRALRFIKPTHIFLNFINYLREQDLRLFSKIQAPTHVGYGPHNCQVRRWDPLILTNSVFA